MNLTDEIELRNLDMSSISGLTCIENYNHGVQPQAWKLQSLSPWRRYWFLRGPLQSQ